MECVKYTMENIQFEKKVSSLVTLPKVKHTRLFFYARKGRGGERGNTLFHGGDRRCQTWQGYKAIVTAPLFSFLYSLKQSHIEEALKEFYIKTASQDSVSALKLFMRPT